MTRDVVLLNGWGMTRAAWQPLVSALPADCSFHSIDLHELGCGDVSQLAAAAADRAPRACDVLAWSLGAQIALQWAHDRPAQVRRAALIAATPCFVARADWPAGMDPAIFDAFTVQFERDPAAALARFAVLQARGDADAGAVARVLRGALCQPAGIVPALQAGLACLRNADLRALAHEVKQPVYLVHGAADELVPVAAAERLNDTLPAARLQAVPAAGHAPQVSQAALLGGGIAGFFS